MLIFLALDLELYDENENYPLSKLTDLLTGLLHPTSEASWASCLMSACSHQVTIYLLSNSWLQGCLISVSTSTSAYLLHFLILRICVPAISPFLPLKPREEGPPLAYVSLAFFGLDLLAFHGLPCVVSSPACYLSLFLFSELCFLTCCFP